MQEAARDLRAAARAAASAHDQALEASLPSDDSELAGAAAEHDDSNAAVTHSERDPKSHPGGKAEADLTALKEAIRRNTGRSWGELPGHLRTAILDTSQGRYREDYARLIQLYFREIAAGAAAPGTAGDKPD